MKIVIIIGGSVLMEDSNPKKFREYAKILRDLSKDHKIWIVIGGGKPAREYIALARSLGANEAQCDDIGIDVTRLNAKLLKIALGDSAYPEIAKNFQEALKFSESKKIVIMGGTEPAHSTDAVGAILAEFVDADILINLTSVDGFYDKDPKKYKDAKFYSKVTISKMLEVLDNKSMAGTYEFFDRTALDVVSRSKIKLKIANGKDPQNLLRVLKGEVGTTVIPK
ncbi:uridylate kinase [Methanothermus fervidus DSM 2088]|uniref:Uridylate kinase n=1 Tax=Methanothermus fervidus (strain ATCC 43054 / DSM 2088 / JCM 10308 / V24 S) TaxID=523846 RepID=E3GZI0_METFV|nr:UMP kinase [Methanothermus fervidus]ADP77712.1 uridylate kinase [Methanothermus fervidus DSM 2088]